MHSASDRIYERFTKPVEMFSKKNRLVWLLLQTGWLHEGCHYIAARLVGLKVYKVTSTTTTVKHGSFWQYLIMVLAPIIPGLVFFPLFVYQFFFGSQEASAQVINYILMNISGMWLAACWADFAYMGDLFRAVEIRWK